MKIKDVTRSHLFEDGILDQFRQVLQPYAGSSLYVPGESPKHRYVPSGSKYQDYTKTNKGWIDSQGRILGSVYQDQLDKLWTKQQDQEKSKNPQITVSPTIQEPANTVAATPPKPFGQRTPPPQVTVPSGEIITKRGNTWYNENGQPVVRTQDIAELERRWKSLAQTRQMARGRSAEKTSILATPPKTRQTQPPPAYSKPPQKKRRR